MASGSPCISASDLWKRLECPVCFEVIHPPILLCENGHHICNSCRAVLSCCPECRGTLTNVRNLFAEETAANLGLQCDFQRCGCQKRVYYKDKYPHDFDCAFNPLTCPACHLMVSKKTILTHLIRKHRWGYDKGSSSTGYFSVREEHLTTEAGFIGSAVLEWEGKQFLPVCLRTATGQWYPYVRYAGSHQEAAQFTCVMKVYQGTAALTFQGPIYSFCIERQEVLQSNFSFSMSDSVVRNLMTTTLEGLRLGYEVSLRKNYAACDS